MARLSSFYILEHPNTYEVLLRKICTFTSPSDRLQKDLDFFKDVFRGMKRKSS